MPPVPKYKYLSGCQKRKKKKLEEERAKADKGPRIHKFFSKLSQSSSSNVDANVGEDNADVNVDEAKMMLTLMWMKLKWVKVISMLI
ncbi:hypothetical protein Hdeb2414_s0317g00866041 [Helianthus debilis subsp. tardiflorus]